MIALISKMKYVVASAVISMSEEYFIFDCSIVVCYSDRSVTKLKKNMSSLLL
jgi:hypothetical protein